MLETFAALFAAHVAADYLAQTERMVRDKDKVSMIALHIGIVFAFSLIAVGFAGWVWIALLAAVHCAMDLTKTHVLPAGKLWPYLLDQGVYIATAVAVALVAPGLVAHGVWGNVWPGAADVMTPVFLIFGFFVFAVRAGGFAIELLMRPMPRVLPGGSAADVMPPVPGLTTGQVERGAVFLLVVAGLPLVIVPVVAVKLAMRYTTVRGDRAALRYLLTGTAVSVIWAIATALVLIALLPDATLETLRLTS
jgi:hypothetical protein